MAEAALIARTKIRNLAANKTIFASMSMFFRVAVGEFFDGHGTF